jgi:hypothetical protein
MNDFKGSRETRQPMEGTVHLTPPTAHQTPKPPLHRRYIVPYKKLGAYILSLA